LILSGYTQLKLFGVGKTAHISALSNWTNGNDVIVAADESPYINWSDWDANQRDLYLLDNNQNIIFHENITSGIPLNFVYLVMDLINQINQCTDGEVNNENPCNPMECYDGEWVEIIIDCAEQMGMPCEGGVYIAPAEDVCCSTCAQYGDSNADGALDVLDVVILVNYILNPDNLELEVSDMNMDGVVNVLDVVTLVNVILNP
tara:strand:- start:16 stop:624 length:609 start_codon:yes stop_codon:yes gene_type:complete